jgi:hypothetical protein
MEDDMANNYQQATVEPTNLLKDLFTEEDLRILALSGIEWEDNGDSYYFFAPEFLCEDGDHSRTYCDVFQDGIRRSHGNVEEVVINGASTCSKMRPGEFGGFVIRISKNEIQSASTSEMLELMQNGRWPLEL